MKNFKRIVLLIIAFIFPIILAACYGVPAESYYPEARKVVVPEDTDNTEENTDSETKSEETRN